MRSLYVVDRPLVEGDLHVGRETRFRRLKELVDTRERLLILCGGRRIGKTSFLNHLSDYLGERYVCFRIDWPSLTEADANAAQPTAKVGAHSRALRRSAGVGPLSRLLLGMSRAMSQPAADSDASSDRRCAARRLHLPGSGFAELDREPGAARAWLHDARSPGLRVLGPATIQSRRQGSQATSCRRRFGPPVLFAAPRIRGDTNGRSEGTS